jgi:acetyltransferase EpsM
MNKVVILGASGHALVVVDILELRKEYEIIGFIDNVNLERHGTEFCKATVLGGLEQLDIIQAKGIQNLLIAIGNSQARLELSTFVQEKGFCLITAIHPQAIIASDVSIGVGTVVCAGAVINPGSRIGNNVVINTSASVDHECVLEDGVHIGPGVHLGGRTTVKRGTWVGIGATISDRVTIGAASIIGAGAVVLKDIPAGVVAYGVPAKIIRKAEANDF